MTKKKQAIAYTRVSTNGQAESGAGLELQRISIEAFAQEAGYAIADTFSDAQSGIGEDSVKTRTGLRAAMEKSKQTGWPILVDGLDRFSRNTVTLEKMVIDGRLKVISTRLGENPNRAVMVAAAERAQAEGERISQTTKEGLRRARERGVTLGNTKNLPEARRLGIATNQRKADDFTRKLAPIIDEITTDQKRTRAQIAEELNRRGLLSPQGKPWSAVTIRPQMERIAAMNAKETPDAYSDNPMAGSF